MNEANSSAQTPGGIGGRIGLEGSEWANSDRAFELVSRGRLIRGRTVVDGGRWAQSG